MFYGLKYYGHIAVQYWSSRVVCYLSVLVVTTRRSVRTIVIRYFDSVAQKASTTRRPAAYTPYLGIGRWNWRSWNQRFT